MSDKMTFSDRLLRYRGLIRLACSDVLHAQQYELEAEALRQELMREHSEALHAAEYPLCHCGVCTAIREEVTP